MIPMLSDLPHGAQTKIRQALVLFGEALIEIAGTHKEAAAQADLFAGTVETVAKTTAEVRPKPVRYDAIPDSQRAAVRELAGTMTCRQIAEQLGIGENRVRYIAQRGGFTLQLARPTSQPASQAVPPPPVEAAPDRTHGAVEATESAENTAPDGRAVPGPDESSLPSSGSEPSHGPFELTLQRMAERESQDWQATVDADLEREELIENQQSEAEPPTPPEAAMAPDAMAEDGAAAPAHDWQMPEAAPSVEDTQNLPGRLNSASREPEAARPPAATEGEAAAEAAVSSPERRRQMIAEAKQAVALRTEVTRPRLREPVKTAMQPTSTDWVRLRHKDGRWLRMDGLAWLDGKSARRENAYLCQRKQLPAVRSKFPLARECVLIDEPKWSPKDITWARGTT